MKAHIYIFLAIFSLAGSAHAQWTLIDSLSIDVLHGIHFIDGNTGYAVGEDSTRGTIYRTSDGGRSFNQIYITTADLEWIYSVHFTSPTTGFAVGENGTIRKTTNGGTSWTTQSFGNVQSFSSVFFPSANVGYAVGKGTPNGPIYKTTDGGNSWFAQSSNSKSYLNSVHFVNETIGYAIGDGDIVKTTNGGVTWSQILVESFSKQDLGSSIFFTDANTGYAVSGTSVKKTTAGGNSFSTNTMSNYLLRDVYFTEPNNGYIVGALLGADTLGIILKTTNAGATWSLQFSGLRGMVQAIHFVDANTGYAVLSRIGKGNAFRVVILKSTNGGGVTSVEQSTNEITSRFALYQNYPNPFNPTTNIEYDLPRAAFVSLITFDMLGQEIANLTNAFEQAGHHQRVFNASALPSGVYFYRLIAGDLVQTRRLVLMR